ncbi:MAG: manganese efflux pump MntP family protein [Spirochaetales bacterium]|jgi:putative Mn2+ efflux pump MntP|nr:manganese efflux pump MntP family protein [Spirochaetales bacterium]
MGFITVFLIALGLAMDAFAVSLCSGLADPHPKMRHALKMGLFCGAFQFFMTVLGWFLGSAVTGYIERFDHWIAFALLTFIGGRMILSAFRKKSGDDPAGPPPEKLFETHYVILLATATSIDALAVGVGFAVLDLRIVETSALIGLVAFIFSAAGVLTGKTLGPLLQGKAEFLGGCILVIIGTRILTSHLL